MPEKKRYRKSCKDNTFVIRLLDYQHNTWQGEITFMGVNQTQCFRSAFEMLSLINSTVGTVPQAEAQQLEAQ